MTIRLVVARADRKNPKYSFYHGHKNGRDQWGGPKNMFFFSSLFEARQFASINPSFSVFIAEQS